jgi:multiple sugar transport system substrate-binding protein
MLHLEFSTFFGDFDELDTLLQLLGTFNKNRKANVKTKRMHWMTSWSDLVNVVSLGSGPDVSQIGNTWISSLTGLNAIRSIKPIEAQDMGGDALFADRQIPSPCWSIPWTRYAFVICYRKDNFAAKSIDPTTAFANQPAAIESIRTLGDEWLAPVVPHPYPDLLHIAASWVWGNGGELVAQENHHPQVVFDQPAAMQGFWGWLESYRAISPDRRLSARDGMVLFTQGKISAMVLGIRMAQAMLSAIDPKMHPAIGFAPISQVPWVGGDSLVIWKHAQREPEREKLGLDLIKFLTSKDNVVEFCRLSHSLPARQDALEELYTPDHPLHETIQVIDKQGRCYPVINAWRSIERQLIEVLDSIIFEAYKNPTRSSQEILERHLPALAQRLNRTI